MIIIYYKLADTKEMGCLNIVIIVYTSYNASNVIDVGKLMRIYVNNKTTINNINTPLII